MLGPCWQFVGNNAPPPPPHFHITGEDQGAATWSALTVRLRGGGQPGPDTNESPSPPGGPSGAPAAKRDSGRGAEASGGQRRRQRGQQGAWAAQFPAALGPAVQFGRPDGGERQPRCLSGDKRTLGHAAEGVGVPDPGTPRPHAPTFSGHVC